jgi:hypothetical protein
MLQRVEERERERSYGAACAWCLALPCFITHGLLPTKTTRIDTVYMLPFDLSHCRARALPPPMHSPP